MKLEIAVHYSEVDHDYTVNVFNLGEVEEIYEREEDIERVFKTSDEVEEYLDHLEKNKGYEIFHINQ